MPFISSTIPKCFFSYNNVAYQTPKPELNLKGFFSKGSSGRLCHGIVLPLPIMLCNIALAWCITQHNGQNTQALGRIFQPYFA
jgi:hypothetical protein